MPILRNHMFNWPGAMCAKSCGLTFANTTATTRGMKMGWHRYDIPLAIKLITEDGGCAIVVLGTDFCFILFY